MQQTTPLKLLHGGRATNRKINGVTVSLVDRSAPLPSVSVRVFEEDTHLVLTKDPVIVAPVEHPIRLMTDIMDTRPHRPGALVIDKHWYAVVLDLDADILCRECWVLEVCRAIFQQVKEARVSSLSLPLLGNVHGALPSDTSLRVILSVLREASTPSLQRLQLETPKTIIPKAITALHADF